jgi:hypothetical protein
MMLAVASLAASALGQTTGLAGRVVQSITRAPVPGVKVRASSEWQVTGPDGRFSFRDLPPGRYLVEVETEKYLRPPIGYAATLTSGQVLGGIEIALTPLASVQGKVVDSEGMPVSFIAVKLIPKKGREPASLVPPREMAVSRSSASRRASMIWWFITPVCLAPVVSFVPRKREP